MAGFGSLDDLYQTFLGQTNAAYNQPESPWQQELMASVNPDKVRRDNIKQAIAQASMALATTPGNFLQGLSTAAGVGANSYLQAKQDAEQNRLKAMQLVQLAQQKDQDRRLSLLMDAIGVNRNIKSDERDAQETDARVAYYGRRGTSGNSTAGGLSLNQVATTRRQVWGQMTDLRKTLKAEKDPVTGERLYSDAEIESQVDDFLKRSESYYGFPMRGDTGASNDPASNAPDPEADGYEDDSGDSGDTGGDLMSGGAQPNIPDRRSSVSQPATLTPPRQAIEALRADPSRRSDFDAKYGQGAAARYLGS